MTALLSWWRLDVEQLAPDAASDTVERTGVDLLARLQEPHRRYHTAQHLVEMFWALEELEAGGELGHREAALARVAGWFHDAVYDPSAPSGQNEADSSGLAGQVMGLLQFGPADTDTVRALVDATVTHESSTATGLLASFSDADLWILSAPTERYDAYCAQVREEYADVPADAFAAGRAAVLQPFLDRETVYATLTAQLAWESAARENLSRELARLR